MPPESRSQRLLEPAGRRPASRPENLPIGIICKGLPLRGKKWRRKRKTPRGALLVIRGQIFLTCCQGAANLSGLCSRSDGAKHGTPPAHESADNIEPRIARADIFKRM